MPWMFFGPFCLWGSGFFYGVGISDRITGNDKLVAINVAWILGVLGAGLIIGGVVGAI